MAMYNEKKYLAWPMHYCTGCSLNIVFFPRILESLPPLPRQHSAAIGCTKNCTPIGVTVHSLWVESIEGLLQRCKRERGCSELWKNTFFPEHPVYNHSGNYWKYYVRTYIKLRLKIIPESLTPCLECAFFVLIYQEKNQNKSMCCSFFRMGVHQPYIHLPPTGKMIFRAYFAPKYLL